LARASILAAVPLQKKKKKKKKTGVPREPYGPTRALGSCFVFLFFGNRVARRRLYYVQVQKLPWGRRSVWRPVPQSRPAGERENPLVVTTFSDPLNRTERAGQAHRSAVPAWPPERTPGCCTLFMLCCRPRRAARHLVGRSMPALAVLRGSRGRSRCSIAGSRANARRRPPVAVTRPRAGHGGSCSCSSACLFPRRDPRPARHQPREASSSPAARCRLARSDAGPPTAEVTERRSWRS